MGAGVHGVGIVIERVLNPPIAPARRFRGVLDTAFTIALGSVCAFALTFGPAPLNTVAESSAAAASFAGLDPAPTGALLLPKAPGAGTTVDQHRRAAEQRAGERSAATPPITTQPATPPGARGQSPAEQPAPNPGLRQPVETPVTEDPASAAFSEQLAAETALAISEAFRTASGLVPAR